MDLIDYFEQLKKGYERGLFTEEELELLGEKLEEYVNDVKDDEKNGTGKN